MAKTKHRLPQPPARGGYVMGCRCDDCVQANRDYQREYLQRRVKAGIVDSHGKRHARSVPLV